jgi:DNA repair protein RadC
MAFLNRANQVVRVELLSKGGINGTVVDVRIIMNRAVLHKASALIVAHNHPSENLSPSEQDKVLTKRLKETCNLFEMQLIDHVIMGNHRYFSFADEGII